tara:strand:+ start:32814 stop:32945 length:132 start_codon:yes stop_codon:yes gene_type:complete
MGFSIRGKEIISSGDEELKSSSTEESTEEVVLPIPTPTEEEAQ